MKKALLFLCLAWSLLVSTVMAEPAEATPEVYQSYWYHYFKLSYSWGYQERVESWSPYSEPYLNTTVDQGAAWAERYGWRIKSHHFIFPYGINQPCRYYDYEDYVLKVYMYPYYPATQQTPIPAMERATISNMPATGGQTVTFQSQSTLRLKINNPQPGYSYFVRLYAWAVEVTDFSSDFWNSAGGQYVYDKTRISILGQPLNSSGYVDIWIAGDGNLNVTPTLANSSFYWFNVVPEIRYSNH